MLLYVKKHKGYNISYNLYVEGWMQKGSICFLIQ